MERFILADYHPEYMDDKDLVWQTTDFDNVNHIVKTKVDEFATDFGTLYKKTLEENTDHFIAVIDSWTGIVYTGDDRGGLSLISDVRLFLGA